MLLHVHDYCMLLSAVTSPYDVIEVSAGSLLLVLEFGVYVKDTETRRAVKLLVTLNNEEEKEKEGTTTTVMWDWADDFVDSLDESVEIISSASR